MINLHTALFKLNANWPEWLLMRTIQFPVLLVKFNVMKSSHSANWRVLVRACSLTLTCRRNSLIESLGQENVIPGTTFSGFLRWFIDVTAACTWLGCGQPFSYTRSSRENLFLNLASFIESLSVGSVPNSDIYSLRIVDLLLMWVYFETIKTIMSAS
jgi:hypothetical protein